jgi:hypothetical protein
MPDPLNRWFAEHPRFAEMADELSHLARDPKWRRLVELEMNWARLMDRYRKDPDLVVKFVAPPLSERHKDTYLFPADEYDELESLRRWFSVAREALLNKYGWHPKH